MAAKAAAKGKGGLPHKTGILTSYLNAVFAGYVNGGKFSSIKAVANWLHNNINPYSIEWNLEISAHIHSYGSKFGFKELAVGSYTGGAVKCCDPNAGVVGHWHLHANFSYVGADGLVYPTTIDNDKTGAMDPSDSDLDIYTNNNIPGFISLPTGDMLECTGKTCQ
jgi:hypothetical protein